MSSASAFNLDQSIDLSFGKELKMGSCRNIQNEKGKHSLLLLLLLQYPGVRLVSLANHFQLAVMICVCIGTAAIVIKYTPAYVPSARYLVHPTAGVFAARKVCVLIIRSLFLMVLSRQTVSSTVVLYCKMFYSNVTQSIFGWTECFIQLEVALISNIEDSGK